MSWFLKKKYYVYTCFIQFEIYNYHQKVTISTHCKRGLRYQNVQLNITENNGVLAICFQFNGNCGFAKALLKEKLIQFLHYWVKELGRTKKIKVMQKLLYENQMVTLFLLLIFHESN